MDAVEDISVKVSPSFAIKDDEEKKRARQALADGPITLYLDRIARRLEARGGEWFADGRITVADLKVFVWIRHLESGNLDHVPTDLVDRVAPELAKHYERVGSHPGVKAYYEQHGSA
jgi:glutathione S-transferase